MEEIGGSKKTSVGADLSKYLYRSGLKQILGKDERVYNSAHSWTWLWRGMKLEILIYHS